jgi:hypothetical protein
MTPPMGTPISSYYATSPLTLMSGGAVSPIPNGSIGEGPAQMRKLFIGGLNHETTDEQVCFGVNYLEKKIFKFLS